MKTKIQAYIELIDPLPLINTFAPFLIAMLYAYYNYRIINWPAMGQMIMAATFLQLALNINDDFWDHKRALKRKFTDKQNPIATYHLNIKFVASLIGIFFAISLFFAIQIGLETNLAIWLLGIFCYSVAVFYSTGNFPISSTPFSEPLVGIAMGFGIFFVTLYLNVYQSVVFDWTFIWPALLAAGASVISSANLMLANNICDMKADLKIGRHTIASYLGIKKSIVLLAGYYLLGYGTSILCIMTGKLPVSALLLEILVLPLMLLALRSIWKWHSKQLSFPKILQTNIALAAAQMLGLLVVIF